MDVTGDVVGEQHDVGSGSRRAWHAPVVTVAEIADTTRQAATTYPNDSTGNLQS